MFTIKKPAGRDLRVLNLTDTHLTADEWEGGESDKSGGKNRKILEYTIDELMKKTSPDLVTVSGDITFADFPRADLAYGNFADLMESYKTPWAFVWGNHDNQAGAAEASRHADILLSRPHCLFEKGDPELGCGNYVIRIDDGEKPIYALFMMDSHDRFDFTDADGKVSKKWGHLTRPQLEWYKNEAGNLGGLKSTLIMHIPYYAYRDAFDAAWNHDYDPMKVTPAEGYDPKYWNEGYKTSYGSKYEGVGSYPADTGDFDFIRSVGSTELTLVGHEHVNNYVIDYKGTRIAYSLKTGAGCYWTPALNGGTLLSISEKGAVPEHIFVNVDHIVNG